MFIDPQVIKTTAFLVKNDQYVGTVFFIRVGLRDLDFLLAGRGSQHYAVTVSHCIPDDRIDIEWPTSSGQNPMPTLGREWVRNDAVDLAVLPLTFDPVDYGIQPLPFLRFSRHLKDVTTGESELRVQSGGIAAEIGGEVYTTGLFHGDDRYPVVTQPIVRFGHIALSSASNEEITILNRFGDGVPIRAPLVEMAVWRGQSGSPIFSATAAPDPPPDYYTRTKYAPYWNTYLLGVAQGFYAGRQDLEINGAEVTLTGLGMGISVVIPSSEIIKILMDPLLVEGRERKLQEILKDNAPEMAELAKRYKGVASLMERYKVP